MNKSKRFQIYAVISILILGVLYFLVSGTIDKSSDLENIQKIQKDLEKTTTTLIIKDRSIKDAPGASKDAPEASKDAPGASKDAPETSQNDPDVSEDDTEASQNDPDVSEDDTEASQNDPDVSEDDSTQNTKEIMVLGLGDLEENFNSAYGAPKVTIDGSEYSFIASTIAVIFAPDINNKNRAWQIIFFQNPSSKRKALELTRTLIPKDSVILATNDFDNAGYEESYRSATLASLYPSDIFLDGNAKPDLGFFRVIYDMDDSNLVYQIKIIGGHFNF